MKGWKTWVAVACATIFGALCIRDGNTDAGMQFLVLAAGFLGIGSKIDRKAEK